MTLIDYISGYRTEDLYIPYADRYSKYDFKKLNKDWDFTGNIMFEILGNNHSTRLAK
jgi:hypothetical protein